MVLYEARFFYDRDEGLSKHRFLAAGDEDAKAFVNRVSKTKVANGHEISGS